MTGFSKTPERRAIIPLVLARSYLSLAKPGQRLHYNPLMSPDYFPVKVRVRYAETDQMGVVHHAVYPVWFEVARSTLARESGVAYSEWERQGFLLMVAELRCRYRRPARYDEEVTVGVRVAQAASRRVVFAYRVESESGELLVEGETVHVTVDRATGRPTIAPRQLRESLGKTGDREPGTGNRAGD
jgi:acyl-CoA thioester hydrolase